jgi:hypothetical protein
MGKYGNATIKAVKLIETKLADSPIIAWDMATTEVFGKGTSGQTKGCPRNTFLGLCEEGKVKGIHPGNYAKSKRNKEYALKALQILKDTPSLSSEQELLWLKVQNGESKTHNYQMDVVCALWNDGLIDNN